MYRTAPRIPRRERGRARRLPCKAVQGAPGWPLRCPRLGGLHPLHHSRARVCAPRCQVSGHSCRVAAGGLQGTCCEHTTRLPENGVLPQLVSSCGRTVRLLRSLAAAITLPRRACVCKLFVLPCLQRATATPEDTQRLLAADGPPHFNFIGMSVHTGPVEIFEGTALRTPPRRSCSMGRSHPSVWAWKASAAGR